MATAIAFCEYRRRLRRRLPKIRIFRDRTHPLEVFDDAKVYKKFRFPREAIYELTDEIEQEITYPAQRKGCLTPVLQVLLALRFYANGSFQHVVADLIGVDQSTVCRTVTRVTNALFRNSRRHIKMPTQAQANASKAKFFAMQRFLFIYLFI
jgi:hypothetical protein